jgi:hypothetical protein
VLLRSLVTPRFAKGRSKHCHPEPIRFAQGKLREGSGSRGTEMLRFAQHDIAWITDIMTLPLWPPRCVLMLPPQHDSVWITDIMTHFTLIVSTASKPLRGRLNHQVTMMGNQVMMMVIHT